jgi:hypothetical protein
MAGYAWVEALEAYCFTAVVGLDVDEAIRRLGGDPARGRRPAHVRRVLLAGRRSAVGPGGAVAWRLLVAEHNGWRAEEEAEPLSRGGRLACFFRNVHADHALRVRGRRPGPGRVRPAARHRAADRARPARIDPALQGLPFGLFGPSGRR